MATPPQHIFKHARSVAFPVGHPPINQKDGAPMRHRRSTALAFLPALLAILVLGACGGPSVVPGATMNSRIASKQMTTAQEPSTAIAECQPGEILIGGGFSIYHVPASYGSTPGPDSIVLVPDVIVLESAPLEDPVVRRWKVTAAYTSLQAVPAIEQDPATLVAVAHCVEPATPITVQMRLSQSIDVQTAQKAETAACPAGTGPTAGGFRLSGNGATAVDVTSSSLLKASNAWQIQVQRPTDSGTQAQLTAVALCVSRVTVTPQGSPAQQEILKRDTSTYQAGTPLCSAGGGGCGHHAEVILNTPACPTGQLAMPAAFAVSSAPSGEIVGAIVHRTYVYGLDTGQLRVQDYFETIQTTVPGETKLADVSATGLCVSFPAS